MINLKKQDSIADAVKEILQQEALKGNQHKIDKNKNNKIDAEDFKLLRKEENVDEALKGNQHKIDKNKNNKIDAEDFKILRKEDTVEENAFDYKSPRQPEPNGGSGVKKGTRYGGSKQKEKPEQEEPKKEETSYFKERLIEKAMLKMAAKKVFKALTGGSDKDQLKDLQRKMNVPQTGKKPSDKAMGEEVEQIDEGLMTGITLGKKVKNDEGGHDQDVHHKGKKIGTISSYSHRTGTKYGMSHDASGDAMAGSRSHEEALSDLRQSHAEHLKSMKNEEVGQVQEVAPPGFEGTVKAMKKHKDIDNPWALAWSMKNKGYKSHKKADGSDK